jgi:hypothetical protein
MMAGTTGRLRLRARDEEDLRVIAGVLQDALVAPGEIAYLPDERRFVAILNRFRWEAASEPASTSPGREHDEREGDASFAEGAEPACVYERTMSALCIDRVQAVQRRGIKRDGTLRFLELLTIGCEDGAIVLRFAGGAAVRLETRGILCHLEDLGEPWPTHWRPQHPNN